MAKRIQLRAWGLGLLAIAAVAGMALAVYSYYLDLGINHTDGVLLVIGTTLIMAIAALTLVWARGMRRWLRGIILLVILIDIIATGVAGWFLETELLIVLMGVALLGWLAHVVVGPGQLPRANQRIAS